jgi:hypothetical protein
VSWLEAPWGGTGAGRAEEEIWRAEVSVTNWQYPRSSGIAIAARGAVGDRSTTSLTPLTVMSQERRMLSVWGDVKTCGVTRMEVSGYHVLYILYVQVLYLTAEILIGDSHPSPE